MITTKEYKKRIGIPTYRKQIKITTKRGKVIRSYNPNFIDINWDFPKGTGITRIIADLIDFGQTAFDKNGNYVDLLQQKTPQE